LSRLLVLAALAEEETRIRKARNGGGEVSGKTYHSRKVREYSKEAEKKQKAGVRRFGLFKGLMDKNWIIRIAKGS